MPIWDLEGFTPGTLHSWYNQGFPIGVSPYEYFGFDRELTLPLNFGPIPSFNRKILEENDKYVTFINEFGFVEKQSKIYTSEKAGYQAYHYIDTPTKTREDWENYKKRYNPKDMRRFPSNWGNELFEYYRTLDVPIKVYFVWGPGRGPKAGYTMGVERFLQTIWKDPDLIHDIMSSYADFCIGVLEEAVRVRIDYVVFMEDGLAYRHGPIISPKTYEEFWYPYHKKVIDFLRSHGINIICWYTSGNIEPLIPPMLKAGFNAFAPLEVAAGMDAIKLREQYGNRILLLGNISRQALMDGPKAIEKEFYRKVPYLMEQGGYIPAADDMILPDISFRSFKHYIDLLKSLKL
ncbi:MAG: uroporphyrinogen decarboxylase family protein [Candidatus Bathyarchaeia archaeon]